MLHAVADLGYSDAQFGISLMYRERLGVPQDNVAAIGRYAMAAEQIDANAISNLRVMEDEGFKALEAGNNDLALRLFQALAEIDSARAQYGLGIMYREGLGVSQSDEEAEKWLGETVGQGLPEEKA